MILDIELLMSQLETLMQSGLNTKIAEINTRKSDSITLATIPSDAYFFQSLNGKQVNYNPYVYYGVQQIDPTKEDGNYGHTEEILTIAVAIIVADQAEDINISNRMFRYGRVLKEFFEENFDSLKNGIKLSVSSQVPIELSLLNEQFKERAVGVLLKTNMG